MTLRAFLIIVGMGTLLAWATAGLLLGSTHPATAPVSAYALLYASLFLGIAGVSAMLGLALRMFAIRKGEVVSRQAAIAFRQAALFSGMLVGALALQAAALLTWWNAALLVVAATLLETLFISGKAQQ